MLATAVDTMHESIHDLRWDFLCLKDTQGANPLGRASFRAKLAYIIKTLILVKKTVFMV